MSHSGRRITRWLELACISGPKCTGGGGWGVGGGGGWGEGVDKTPSLLALLSLPKC